MPTRLQNDAPRRSIVLRSTIATELRRLREDAGVSCAAMARVAGVSASTVAKAEAGSLHPTLEAYVRIAAALGADFAARVYPNTGPPIRDRHQVRMLELVLATLHSRWTAIPEVAVRRPARGSVDVALHDRAAQTVVATELESDVRRVEQVVRWSQNKAESLPSASAWPSWSDGASPIISRLLVVRSTRMNRDAADAARRQLRAAYPADPRDALDALAGLGQWPGPSMLWARLDTSVPRLVPW